MEQKPFSHTYTTDFTCLSYVVDPAHAYLAYLVHPVPPLSPGRSASFSFVGGDSFGIKISNAYQNQYFEDYSRPLNASSSSKIHRDNRTAVNVSQLEKKEKEEGGWGAPRLGMSLETGCTAAMQCIMVCCKGRNRGGGRGIIQYWRSPSSIDSYLKQHIQ